MAVVTQFRSAPSDHAAVWSVVAPFGVAVLLAAGACEAVPVDPNAVRRVDLAVSHQVSVASPPEGGTTIFTVTVRNVGSEAADSVIVRDSLTAGLTRLSTTPTAGTYDPLARTWYLGSLDPNETMSMQVSVRTGANTDGSAQTHGALVYSAIPEHVDSNQTNNLSTRTITVSGVTPSTVFANEPPGFVAVTNNFWTQHTGGGWTYTGPDPSGNFTHVVTTGYGDPPPVGGPAVLEAVYNANSQGGSGPGRTGYSFPGGINELFVGMWHKYSFDYPHSPVNGGNKMWFMLVGPARSYLVFRERADDPLSRFYSLALDSFQPLTGIASSPGRLIPYGVWYKMEWYMRRNTTGQANGIARFWMNGELLVDLNNLVYPGPINAFYLEGTNNGASGTSIIPRAGRWWMAQTRLSVPGTP